MNNITLVGRLTKAPELRYIAGSGTAVATFNLAVDRDFTNKDGKKETDFIPVQVWGKMAENCANYLDKGYLAGVAGSLRVENYEDKDGTKRRNFRVNATSVKFLEPKKANGKISSGVSNEDKNLNFEPSGLDPQGFQAIDDDDIPF